MQRRRFLTHTLPAACGAAALGCADERSAPAVVTDPQITWRLASSFPRSLDTIYGACDVLASRVLAMTGGRFRIRAYEGGELVPGLQVLDAVQQGTVQCGQSASYYFVGKNPVLAFDCTVPFGLTPRQQSAWLTEGGGLERMRRAFADFNVVPFPGGNTGAQMGGWFKHEIPALADLRGLKMRIPGLGGRVMGRLGVTVQVLAGGDIFPALERGAIDATEWVGPYDDEKLGFHKVAKHYYYPGWWEPGPSLSFYVNRDQWAKLPTRYQEVFTSAAAEASVVMQARYDARNPAALARLRAEGVELHPFSAEIMAAAERASTQVMEEQAAADPGYREVYDAWKAFRSESHRWFGTAELAYAKHAFG